MGEVTDTLPLRHGLYLTVGDTEDGRTLAVCSDGTPQFGHAKVTVLTIKVVRDMAEAKRWFADMKTERPWETRQ